MSMKPKQINYRTYSNHKGTIHKKVLDITDAGVVQYEIVYKKGFNVTVGDIKKCEIQTFATWCAREVKG